MKSSESKSCASPTAAVTMSDESRSPKLRIWSRVFSGSTFSRNTPRQMLSSSVSSASTEARSDLSLPARASHASR